MVSSHRVENELLLGPPITGLNHTREMSSDGHVSDHGRQVVESIEDFDDVKLGGMESSGEENKVVGGPIYESASQDRSFAKHEKSSDGEAASDDVDDSSDESNSLEDITKSGNKISRTKHRISDDEYEPDDEDGLSKERIPPSYQVPPGDSEYSAEDTDSTTSSRSSPGREIPRHEQNSRKRKSPTGGPDLGLMESATDFRPLKKARGALNRAYLDLLNEDIQHAASQYAPVGDEQFDKRKELPDSQIGMCIWTSMEKERFFEALGRLGRDNVAGISQRVRTKGEMEIRQYIRLLQDGLSHRRQQNRLEPLELADFPAAVELSHECCQALEDMADHIATKQENFESTAEERKHGSGWLVSQHNHKDLAEETTEKDTTEVANVFRTREWLALSERFFMNAPSEDGNWQSVDGDTPSVRLTTLQDFHALAVTLTKRLVASSLYVATARIRAEYGSSSSQRRSVRVKDVDAAAMSLGLLLQKPPLTGCVRRLGLSVYEEPPKPFEHDEREPMPYSAVEDELNMDGQQNVSRLRHQLGRIALSTDPSSASSDSSTGSESEPESDQGKRGSSADESESEEEEVKEEANEAILYSAADPPLTARGRQALLRQIKAEKAQERHADMVDAQASYQEETHMWDMLGKQPPEALVDPGPPSSSRKLKLSVDASYSVGVDWRAKTRVTSEWEALYQKIV